METFLALFFIAFLIVGTVMTYRHKKIAIKQFLISENTYPQLVIGIYVEKTKGKLSAVKVQIKGIETLTLNKLKLELITRKREFNYYDLSETHLVDGLPQKLNKQHSTEFSISYSDLKNLLEQGQLPFRTFRFVATDSTGKPYKSHELGLDKKWQIMRPDSGHYN